MSSALKQQMLKTIILFILLIPFTLFISVANSLMTHFKLPFSNLTIFFVFIGIVSITLPFFILAIIPGNYIYCKLAKYRKLFLSFNIIVLFFTIYQYLSITIFDLPPRQFNKVKFGMSKENVERIIGPPDYLDGTLSAYYFHGEGFTGRLMPMYLEYDKKSNLLNMWN